MFHLFLVLLTHVCTILESKCHSVVLLIVYKRCLVINVIKLVGYCFLLNVTRARSRWGAIANPHAKVFDHPAPRCPIPGHDLGNRMKILFNKFSIFYL